MCHFKMHVSFTKTLKMEPKDLNCWYFATFLTLAYNNIIIVSAELLNGSMVTDIQGNSSQYLLLAPTVPYFGKQHLPYAILAIVVFSTFIALPPLLLISYPTKTFQKLLGCLKIRWPALHIFADVFQGCYKNRTDGKYDYRWFAAFYLTVRIILFVICVIPNIGVLGWTIGVIVLGISSLMFALLRPYKKNWLNILDSLILASLGLAALWIVYNLETEGRWFQLIGFIASIPLVYFVVYVAYKIISWLRILQKFQQNSKDICQFLQQRWRGHDFRQQRLCDEEQLPDRLINPCEYQPLPKNRDKDGDDGSETDNLPIIGAYPNEYGSIN